jgi:SAM-dependent methyltransferase
MYALEDRYWWFVGRRRLAVGLAAKYGVSGTGLDIGCGTGAATLALAELCEVTGADMSPEALEFSKSRGCARQVLADGQALPFQGSSFDVVMGLDVYEHIPDDVQAFSETFRVLKSGGHLVMSVPAFRFLWSPHDVALMHHRRYTSRELRQKLEQAGFRVEKLSYSVFFLFPLVLISRVVEKFKTGTAKASLPPVPGLLNSALISLQSVEARLISATNLPWGSSVVAVAKKP